MGAGGDLAGDFLEMPLHRLRVALWAERARPPALHAQACERIAALDKQIRRLARPHDVCRRFMTVPGVGPITALSV